MPRKEASPVDQRTQFITDFLRDTLSMTELCALYGVSRKTGYKWIDRYLRHGPAGLEERSRRPRRAPNQTADEIVAAILDSRRRHPTWGGKKLLAGASPSRRRSRRRRSTRGSRRKISSAS
jgi:putative transposase